MIHLDARALEAIRRHAAQAYPHECCGVLGGSSMNGAKQVVAVAPLPNRRVDSPHNRYFAPAGAVRAAEAELAVRGLVVVGFYHSHPDAPARPSPYDLEHATWPWLSYVIVAARSGQAEELTSWVLADDRAAFLPEEIRNGAGAAPDRPEGRSE